MRSATKSSLIKTAERRTVVVRFRRRWANASIECERFDEFGSRDWGGTKQEKLARAPVSGCPRFGALRDQAIACFGVATGANGPDLSLQRGEVILFPRN